jgi:predicted permease
MEDLRVAVRTLGRQPAFAMAVALILGLAVGVNTGFFGVVNALLLRPIPGVDSSGLANLYVTRDGQRDGFSGFSHPTFGDLCERSRSFGDLEAFAGRAFAVGDETATSVVTGQLVSGGFFRLLGTRAARGRLLGPEDDRPGAAPVAVVSHALWNQRFAGREDLVGSTLRLAGHPVTVVGVAEAGFRGHFLGFPMDLFVPLAAASAVAMDVDLEDRLANDLELIGRLRPDATIASAGAEMAVVARDLAQAFPETLRGRGIEVRAYSGLDADLRVPVLGFVAVLSAVGALVLLVACVNVAGLVLARGAAREREMAVRAALGASRRALLRPLLAEMMLLFGAGGLLGAAMAGPSARILHAFLPESRIPLHLDLNPDWRVAFFSVLVTLATGLVFGLVPAVNASRVDILGALKQGGRGPASGSQRRRRVFVATQVALSLVLLVGAFLFLRDLQGARRLDPGFRFDGVGVVTADLRLLNRSSVATQAFLAAWLDRVRARPGIEAAALASALPLNLGRVTTRILVNGVEPPGPEGFEAGQNAVSPGYFETLGIPLLSGRDFDTRDAQGGERVAIVSGSTARRLFPGQEPLGRALRHRGHSLRVVGVASDIVVDRTGRRDHLYFYVPLAQSNGGRASLLLRGGRVPPLEDARQAALALEPDLPVLASETFEQHAGAAHFPQRLAATVTGAFGLFGLLLASLGLYGIVAFDAVQRRHELAIRAALGARSADLRRLVVLQGLRPVAAGVLVGLVASLAFARLIAAFVPVVGAFDGPAFAGGVVLLMTAALLAADLPARRAALVPPIESLRGD